MDKRLEQTLTNILCDDRPFTMPIIYHKPYSENYISDWLAFILNPKINELGNEPLNILLSLAGKQRIAPDESVDFSRPREVWLDKNNRIDFLIPVMRNKQIEYYIAIENKILACEGDNQTERYYQYVKNELGAKGVFIFLTPFGTKAKNTHFCNISYKEFIKELDDFMISDMPDLSKKNRVYINEFINHIRTYILSGDRVSDNDCELLKLGERIEREYKQDKKAPLLQNAHSRLLELKNLFFLQLEKQIKFRFSNKEWVTQTGDCYIQLYKTDWQEYEIHYEIIIPGRVCSKGGIYSGCDVSVMIHAENYKGRHNGANKQTLRKYLNDNGIHKNMVFKNNYKHQLYEIKAIRAAFDTPNRFKSLIEELADQLDALVHDTSDVIDDFVRELKQKNK